MLHIIVGPTLELRKEKRAALVSIEKEAVIFVDDTDTSFEELVRFAFPSLFAVGIPIVHGKFLLEKKEQEIRQETIQTLVASPTVFVLEESGISAPQKKLFEKHGARVYEYQYEKKQKEEATIFAITAALTMTSKKDRWLLFQKCIAEHAPEALVGILFWKLRQLLDRPSKQTVHYQQLYTRLMHAQQRAWQRGVPLALLIEKVLLEY